MVRLVLLVVLVVLVPLTDTLSQQTKLFRQLILLLLALSIATETGVFGDQEPGDQSNNKCSEEGECENNGSHGSRDDRS